MLNILLSWTKCIWLKGKYTIKIFVGYAVLGKFVKKSVKIVELIFLSITCSEWSYKTHKQKVLTKFGLKLFHKRTKGSSTYHWKLQEYTEVKIHKSNKKLKEKNGWIIFNDVNTYLSNYLYLIFLIENLLSNSIFMSN